MWAGQMLPFWGDCRVRGMPFHPKVSVFQGLPESHQQFLKFHQLESFLRGTSPHE